MSTNVSWPVIGGTTYSVPAAGELNWATLSNYLVALQNAQSVFSQKASARVAVTSPVTVASTTDFAVFTNLTVPGPVAVNLPIGVQGQYFAIVDAKGDALTNNITVTPNGAETINGAASYTIANDRGGIVLAYHAATTNWTILAEFNNFGSGTIPRSSIAAATPDYVVINDGTGKLSEEQFLAKSRGGTAIDNTSVTFPSTGVIVTEAAVETLTNKTIDGDDNTLQDISLVSLKTVLANADKVLRRNSSGVVVADNTLPNSSEIVTLDATQILTNKTIDGDVNTVQDLPLTSLKTVLADADKVIRRDASGVVVSGNAIPNSSALLTTDATQTLQNKTSENTVLAGATVLSGLAGATPSIAYAEDPDNGTDAVTVKAPDNLAASYTLTLPPDDGISGQVLVTDGAGITSWGTATGSLDSATDLKNMTLAASTNTTDLTIAIQTKALATPSVGDPVPVGFRSATLTAGDYSVVNVVAATTLTIPSGATLGLSSTDKTYFYLYALNNAGTAELAVSGELLDENLVYSSTAISAAASSYSTLYSTTARANVAIRYLGRMYVGHTLAADWDAVPDEIGIEDRSNSLGDMSYLSAIAGPVSGTFATWFDMCTITLTPGEWDVTGQINFGTGTSVVNWVMAVSQFSTTTTTDHVSGDNQLAQAPPGTTFECSATVANYRIVVRKGTTQNVYLKVIATSGVNCTANARISARRVRLVQAI